MASMNRVMILGNLGDDPKLKTTGNGTSVANFSIATKESYPTKDNQKADHIEWHRVVVWGKLAEVCSRYLSKGSSAFVEGRLQTRKYNKDGVDHYSTEIVATNVLFLSASKKETQQQEESDGIDYSQIPF